MGRKKIDAREKADKQINIRVPPYEAEDWSGVVDSLQASGREGMNLTYLIRWAMQNLLEDLADNGLTWKAKQPGEIRTGRPSNKQLGIEETTNG